MPLIKLTPDHTAMVHNFCDKCKALGWANNSTIRAMKFYENFDRGGGWFGFEEDRELHSVAGYHPLPEVKSDAWRIFYRSATLPLFRRRDRGLHRGNGPRGREYMQAFLNQLPQGDLYITTNCEPNEHVNITRYHRAMQIQAQMRNSYIVHEGDRMLYNTMQSLWRIDRDRYREMLDGLH